MRRLEFRLLRAAIADLALALKARPDDAPSLCRRAFAQDRKGARELEQARSH